MNDEDRQPGAGHADDAATAALGDISPASSGDASKGTSAAPDFDESLFEEAAALIDGGRNYAQAELAFQKNRAALVGKSVGIAVACVILGLILLNIAFLALAVGLVIALAPLVTIWGAIAIVVSVLLLIVGFLIFIAIQRGKMISAMFAPSVEAEDP